MSHGKKTENPGYRSGENWCICDVCGLAYRQSAMRSRWDGAVVCSADWEPRHPQDFVRGREDDISVKGHLRPEPPDREIVVNYINQQD